MKAIIIEDEKLNSDLLTSMINDFVPEVQVVAVCTSVVEAFKEIRLYEDTQLILFLDIELGGSENGFDLLQLIEDLNHDVIITTAFPNYAVQAFRNKAIDFLVKPIRIAELIEAVSRVSGKQKAVSKLPSYNTSREILIQLFNKIVPVQFDDIIFIQSMEGKSQLVLKSGKIIKALDRIGELDLKLSGNNFYRIHQSYIININHLTAIAKEDSGTVVELINDHIVPVSRRLKKDFIKKIRLKGRD